ncbi:PREDICTED: GDSL esterase/lipase At5g55050-like [Nicotiana attenuata]|uniref:Gdsl esteraselipase n=1 Tax=Nicotiana attenuata TaxID=49451 RepID=A0A1J6K960_NICAT|nr:PREDICTED: GDSL esterase/lipase At5g55050-like [Nicotiana attenuata]OIT26634.1 gdsl esteraselipase [Nicotiana attenuata]
MASSSSLLSFFLLFSSFFLLCCKLCVAQSVPAAYMFGDSLVDVGNNNHFGTVIKANFPYNGLDYPGGKSTGRFCNGKNTADFLAEKLGVPTPPPYLADKNNVFAKGVSFASGGAGIFNGTNDDFLSKALHMSQQVQFFSIVQQRLVTQLGSDTAQKQLSKSVFGIAIGSNDIINYFKSDSKLSKTTAPEQYVDQMVSSLQGQLKQLYGLGARKFVIVGVGSIGCIPLLRYQSANKSGECSEQTNYWTNKYNQGLQSVLQGLQSELKDFSYSYFDTFNLLLDVIQNPAIYGFSEVKAACCGLGRLNAKLPCTPISTFCSNRSDHVFWDRYHPTEAANRMIIDSAFDGKQYVFPLNIKQLITL